MKGTERAGIYAIVHLGTGKVYVGSASNISKRWSRHRKELRSGTHKNAHLQAAWLRDGEAAFDFRILEITDDLTAREQHWIDATGCIDPGKGYNKCPIARSSRGRVFSEEERAKRRTAGCAWLNTPEQLAARAERFRAQARQQRKLTMEEVEALRQRVAGHTFKRGKVSKGSPRLTYTSLANEYGVSVSVIWEAINARTYREGGGSTED